MLTARLNFQLRAKLVVIKVAEKGRAWKEFKEFKELKSLKNLFAGLASTWTLPIFLKVALKFKTKNTKKNVPKNWSRGFLWDSHEQGWRN